MKHLLKNGIPEEISEGAREEFYEAIRIRMSF